MTRRHHPSRIRNVRASPQRTAGIQSTRVTVRITIRAATDNDGSCCDTVKDRARDRVRHRRAMTGNHGAGLSPTRNVSPPVRPL